MILERPPLACTRSRQGPGKARGLGLAAVLALVACLAAAPAAASPDTLRRGLGNVVMGPFDMLLAPIQGINTLLKNLEEIDDSRGVRIAYAAPGLAWLTLLNFGSGMIRSLTGALETAPGIVLFASESDVDALFNPVEDSGALFEWDNPISEIEHPWVYYNPLAAPFAIRIKMGINYTRPEY